MQHGFLFIYRASDCTFPKSSDSSLSNPRTNIPKSVYGMGTGFVQCFEREQVKSLPSLCIAKNDMHKTA